ncbi:MAG: hypothetical protein DRP56_08620 [Planctomycetota bacterium]|nr:MAG: hypothetical protein DRP56_08620 [Planctomycetota bacterium]
MQTTEIKSIVNRAGEQRLLTGLQRIGNCYSGTDMAARNRSVTVLFSLIASMTIGAFVLMAMDDHRPITGAYSLSSYLRLDPAEDAVKNTITQTVARWDQVQIYYSRTPGGNADELAILTDLANGIKAQFHFVVANGNGAEDGAIQAGEFWKRQRLCQGRNGVIRVCVISDGRAESVTDCQLKRTGVLVESLIRTFDISPRNIHYPVNWQM